ncbi:STAS domain-containing protein [Niallia taxi]|uniref:STAS domain-containing protein n=1 Tax=Niallia taxi TaxID=2499688 RepID=UPI003D28DD2A
MHTVEILMQDIGVVVKRNKEFLIKQKSDLDYNLYSKEVNKELQTWREELIDIFINSISIDLESPYNHLTLWGNKGVNLLIELNLSLETGIEEVRFYRNSIGEIIKTESIRNNVSIFDFYEIISKFDSIVDQAVHLLSLNYSKINYARISAAEITAMELSIPIIQITEKMGVLPIVGDIDTKRSQELMEKALNSAVELHLSHIFIDLSGVPIIDTMVANHLINVIEALNLVGVQAILSGLRPEIAQTMVQLGINMEHIITYSSLHKAIKHVQSTTY